MRRWRSRLARLRDPRAALPIMAVAPLPILVALVVTARPAYPEDACFYGAPRSSIEATDHYLALMTSLGVVAMAAVAIVALPSRGKLIAPAVALWAAASLIEPDVARPVLVYGGNVVVFGAFLVVPVLVFTIVMARETSWVRALGWFEFLVLLPMLLGVAGVLAQPACYAGDPPAPIR